MKILLTGATGFIGKHLVTALVNNNHGISVLVRKTSQKKEVIWLKAKGCKVVVGDIFDKEILKRSLINIDIVIHLVGGGDVSAYGDKGYRELYTLNVVSIKCLINAVKSHNKINKIIFLSSISAVGVYDRQIIDENTAQIPVSPHELCKAEAERVLVNSGLPYIIIRPPAVYGPMAKYSDILLLSRITQKVHFLPILGNGNNHFPCIYVEDLVQLIIRVVNSNDSNQVFNITHQENPTFNQLVKIIKKHSNTWAVSPHILPIFIKPFIFFMEEYISKFINIYPPLTIHRLDSMTSDRLFNIDKVVKLLGYKEQYTFKQGIKKTINWYRIHGFIN